MPTLHQKLATLTTVLALWSKERDHARAVLTALRHQRTKADAQITALSDHHRHYQYQRAKGMSAAPSTPVLIQNALQFEALIDAALQSARNDWVRNTPQLEAAQQAWQQWEVKVTKLEEIIARHRRDFGRAQEKQDQGRRDEWFNAKQHHQQKLP